MKEHKDIVPFHSIQQKCQVIDVQNCFSDDHQWTQHLISINDFQLLY
jgi:hypothetical protein